MGCIFCPKKKIYDEHDSSPFVSLNTVENEDNVNCLEDKKKSQKNITNECAKEIKNVIENNFPELDELYKASNKCTEILNNTEKSAWSKNLQYNLESKNKELMKNFVQNLFTKKKDELLKIDLDIENFAKNETIKRIKDEGLDTKKSNEIVNFLMKKYKKNNYTGELNIENEYENIKNITVKFNKGCLDTKNTKEKLKIIAGNDAMKSIVISVSILSISYTIIDVAEKLSNYEKFNLEIRRRLEKIEEDFNRHKREIEILPADINESKELIQKVYCNFKEDQKNIKILIEEIDGAIKELKNQRKQGIYNLLTSFGKLIGNTTIAIIGKGDERLEHAKESIYDLLNIVDNTTDIALKQKLIKDLIEKLEHAQKLRNEIDEEIEKLEDRYNDMKKTYYK